MQDKFNLEDLKQKATVKKKENQKFLKSLSQKNIKGLDEFVQNLHQKVFDSINCLECANCCKTLGPRITDKDIEKLAHYQKIRPSDFVERYLRIDEDGDYVFKTMPCPFLLDGNFCAVYEARPKACREYPHTDRRRFLQLSDIMIKNSFICPAVFEILELLKKNYR